MQTNRCFCSASSICRNDLELCKSTCANENRGIMLKGEEILLADLDKYMEVYLEKYMEVYLDKYTTREPGKHVLSMVSGAEGDSWQQEACLLPTHRHLVFRTHGAPFFPSPHCPGAIPKDYRSPAGPVPCLPDLCRHCKCP